MRYVQSLFHRIVIWAAAMAAAAAAADLQVWNNTELGIVEAGRWKWEAFAMLRAREGLSEAYDNRLGSLVRFTVHPRASLTGGYLRRWLDGSGRWGRNRFFGGPAFVLARRPLRVESATLYERHTAVAGGLGSFNRYKQRVEVERTRQRVSPFLYNEFTFLNDGLARSRTLAGFRWRGERGRRMELGYQFESIRSGGAWAPRHTIRTIFNLGTLFKRD